MNAYNSVLSIQRYEHMPYYFYPSGQSVVGFEDGVLKFLDFLVDAHELERNKSDHNKVFYFRALYVMRNLHRYSNDTMANLMFDTQLRKTEYDRMNSVIDTQNRYFYAGATFMHFTLLTMLTYTLRYRTIAKASTLAVGTAYYLGFT